MKTEFKAKFLQHIKQKRQQEGGFTLIELLVVIIIIGILAAIALPNFLNQANRARQAEAESQLGSINRGQQAFRTENGTYATDLTQLDVAVAERGSVFAFAIDAGNTNNSAAVATAENFLGGEGEEDEAGDPAISGFSGVVAMNPANQVSRTAICENNAEGDAGSTAPTGMTIGTDDDGNPTIDGNDGVNCG